MTNNNSQGTINSFATQSVLFTSGSVSGPTINGNVHAGSTTTLSHISSSILYSNNISNSGNLLIRNSATHPAATNGSGSVSVANNIFGGGVTTLTISGSGAQFSKGVNNNIIVGTTNELNVISSGSNAFVSNTGIIGNSLIVSGSNGSATVGGSTFVGRFNATGSLQESTNETVFVVGTGTAANNRRNALRIDSNNNSNFTGSVNISGSLSVNGVPVSGDRNGLITTGSVNGTQSITGSLVFGNNTNAAHSTILQVRAFDSSNQALSVTGSANFNTNNVTITGTQPNNASNTFVIVSGSMKMSDPSGSLRIATANNQPQLFFNPTRKVGFFLGQSNMDQVNTQFGITDDSTDNYTMGGNFNNFRTGSNNLMLGVQNISLRSGSNNIIFARDTQYNTGSNNLILGKGPSGINECQEYFNLQLPNSNDPIMFKSGSANPLTLNSNTVISGSLLVTDKINNLKIWTGSANVNSIGIGNNTLNSQTGSSLNNIAIGGGALQTNVTGANVVAIGNDALRNSVVGFNLAVGASALNANTTGEYNIAIGQSSGQANTIGQKNTSIGWNSFVNNTTGSTNTAIGAQSLQNNISGSGNVAIGNSAGYYSTSSNEFFVGNDNYGSVNTERSGSLFWGQFNSTTANQTLQINAQTNIKGSLTVTGGINYSSGSNTTVGTAVLDGANPATVTVSNSLVTANSLIFLTKQTNNHPNAGPVVVSSKGSGTFTITSNHNGDTDIVAYQIINPA
jgi:hypothetical protein